MGPGLVKQQRQEIKESCEGQPLKSKVVIAIQPVYFLPNVIELSYYSNTLLTHYILDSVVVTALYAMLKPKLNELGNLESKKDEPGNNELEIFQSELVSSALQVCDILKYEFIFCKPCQNLESVIISTIENLGTAGIIQRIDVRDLALFLTKPSFKNISLNYL